MPAFRALLAVLFTASLAAAADWPQWLGPRRDGSTPESVAAWTKPPQVIWHCQLGEDSLELGHASCAKY